MSSQESYAEKIAKLLAKAESTTPEEAEALVSKAQELMAKYAIDEAMIAAARGLSGSKSNPIVSEEFVSVGIYRFPLERLTFYVLRTNGIQVIKLSQPGWRTVDGKVFKEADVLVGVGYKADIDRARVLATSLMLQAIRAENTWWKEHQPLYRGAKRGGHFARRGFLFAFADGVYKKLTEATARGRKAAEEEHGGDSVALVLRDKSLAVKDAFEEMFPETRKSKDRKDKGDMFARAHGFESGQRADVGQPGMSGSGSRKRIES
jgi:hypothetical protein